MKRGRFDADYERVARKPPPKESEFPDAADNDLFERERAERIAAAQKDFHERMAVLAELDRQKAIEAKARADALSKRANWSVLMDEYDRAGIAPPFLKADGTPSCSLSLLLSFGWSIVMVGDTPTLIRPVFNEKPRARRQAPDVAARQDHPVSEQPTHAS